MHGTGVRRGFGEQVKRVSLTCPVLLLLALTACGPVESSTAGTPCQDAASLNLARPVRVAYDTERFGGGGESEWFRLTLREQGTVVDRHSFTCRESGRAAQCS
ncbi:hypothetical protein [Deinococcus xianganensis]|uniref:Lipoprotein n=1 Tax=Deinococcus xianganensis TaxID=1507289 RepID=A0A6I4YG02_9DEIO|nr:hypothetical protein [Deinococcus xianganensis]MXV19828.1 hypothetical protein [Deinococcus xianganensis]